MLKANHISKPGSKRPSAILCQKILASCVYKDEKIYPSASGHFVSEKFCKPLFSLCFHLNSHLVLQRISANCCILSDHEEHAIVESTCSTNSCCLAAGPFFSSFSFFFRCEQVFAGSCLSFILSLFTAPFFSLFLPKSC